MKQLSLITLVAILACSAPKQQEEVITLEDFLTDRVWTNFSSSWYFDESEKSAYVFSHDQRHYSKVKNIPHVAEGWIHFGDYKISSDTMYLFTVTTGSKYVDPYKLDFTYDVVIGSKKYNTLLWESDTLYSEIQ